MGWKNVREHYRIGHIVKLVDGNVHVGSSFVGDLLSISPEGAITRSRIVDRHGGDLGRYQDEIEADPARFVELLRSPDTFERSIPVFTWEGARIVERLCEETGWPNVTHDGDLMHDNRYSTDRDKTVARAIRDAEAGVSTYERAVEDAREELARREALLAGSRADVAILRAERPGP
jgi:hypothetical protein